MGEDLEFLPTIPVDELIKIIADSDKIEKQFKIGTTHIIILKGSSYIGKRSISLRSNLQDVGYDYAIGVGYKARKISAVMDWFHINRNFKEGAYVVCNEDSVDVDLPDADSEDPLK